MRRLVVGGATYLWRVTHRHHAGADGQCHEVFSAFLEGRSRAPLRVIFTGAQESIERAGIVTYGNLNEPRVARSLIELGMARGWAPGTDGRPFEILNP